MCERIESHIWKNLFGIFEPADIGLKKLTLAFNRLIILSLTSIMFIK